MCVQTPISFCFSPKFGLYQCGGEYGPPALVVSEANKLLESDFIKVESPYIPSLGKRRPLRVCGCQAEALTRQPT